MLRVYIGFVITVISLLNIAFIIWVNKSPFTYEKKIKYLTMSNNLSKFLFFIVIVNFILYLFN